MNSSIEFSIKNYNGPLDVLLELIKKEQVDIFDIDLLELTTQYLKFIESLDEDDLDDASEYLVMATILIQLKARMLLDIPEEKEEVEIDKKKLLKRLSEYQQFKQIADKLRDKELQRQATYIRPALDLDEFITDDESARLDGHSRPLTLVVALRKLFERRNLLTLATTTLETNNISPAEREDEIRELLKNKESLKFDDIFHVPTLKHFFITLLAILDMSRKQEIIIEQKTEFGEIIIRRVN